MFQILSWQLHANIIWLLVAASITIHLRTNLYMQRFRFLQCISFVWEDYVSWCLLDNWKLFIEDTAWFGNFSMVETTYKKEDQWGLVTEQQFDSCCNCSIMHSVISTAEVSILLAVHGVLQFDSIFKAWVARVVLGYACTYATI